MDQVERYLQHLLEHEPHGQPHDDRAHGARYEDNDQDVNRKGSKKAEAYAKELGDHLDDLGEYIHLTMQDGTKVSFTNWEEVEDFEYDRFLRQGGNPAMIGEIPQGDPAVKAPQRGDQKTAGEHKPVEKDYEYDEDGSEQYEGMYNPEDPEQYAEQHTDAPGEEVATSDGPAPTGEATPPPEKFSKAPGVYVWGTTPTSSQSSSGSEGFSDPAKKSNKPVSRPKPVGPVAQPNAFDPVADAFANAKEFGMRLAAQYGVAFEDGGHFVKIDGRTFPSWQKAIPYMQRNYGPKPENHDEAEQKARTAVPMMAQGKQYGLSEQNGKIVLMGQDSTPFYFDTWEEASQFLERAPVSKAPTPTTPTPAVYTSGPLAGKPVQKAYDPTLEEEQARDAEDYWQQEQYQDQQLMQDQEYAQQQQREQDQYELGQQREEEQYGLNQRRQGEQEMRLSNQQAADQLAQLGVQAGAYGRYAIGPQVFEGPDAARQALRELMVQQALRKKSQANRAELEALLRGTQQGHGQPMQKSISKAYGDGGTSFYDGRHNPGDEPYDLQQDDECCANQHTQVLLYENPIQPPMVPPGDPSYRTAEYEAKCDIEAKMIELGGQIHGQMPSFTLELPMGYEPAKSPEFTSWQQAAQWMGVEVQKQPLPPDPLAIDPEPEPAMDPMAPQAPMGGVPFQESIDYREYRRRRFKEGGEGSGNFDHAGRPGQVGGSAPQSGGDRGGKTIQSKTSSSRDGGERKAYQPPAKRKDPPSHWEENLPQLYGGIYGTLMRQYFLGRPRKPVEYPKYTDLTDAQRKEIEKIEQNPLIQAAYNSSVADNVTKPIAQKIADGIDFMTYDREGRRIQDYVNLAGYLLGIHAKGKYKAHVHQKLAEENFGIERENAAGRMLQDISQTGWIDKETGEFIPKDDPRVPKPPAVDQAERFRFDSLSRSNSTWNKLSAEEKDAWRTLAREQADTRGNSPSGRSSEEARAKSLFGQGKGSRDKAVEFGRSRNDTSAPEYRDYGDQMDAWRKTHAPDKEGYVPKARKEMPRWLEPKSEVGRVGSYLLNPFSIAINTVASMFMGWALPEISRNLKQYAKGDARAFNYPLKAYISANDDEVRESEDLHAGQSLADDMLQAIGDEDKPMVQAIGQGIADNILDRFADMDADEINLSLSLMAVLAEENARSLADQGEPLPKDDEGLPMLSLKAQKALVMSDEERERLTPIALQLIALIGLYTAWPVVHQAMSEDKE